MQAINVTLHRGEMLVGDADLIGKGPLFGGQRVALLYSSKSRIPCQHFFEVFLLLVSAVSRETAYL